jgi:hypothetical protein
MISAISKSLYVGVETAQKVGVRTAQIEHWNRLPDSVLYDKELSTVARCVYAVLAGSAHQGSTASLGHRRIAGRLGIHKETAGKAIAELASRGHVTVSGAGKFRRIYTLHSAVFGQKQGKHTEIVSNPSHGKRYASLEKTA